MANNKNYKSKFSRAERAAYHSGKGYAVAHAKRGINFKNGKVKEAFRQGFNKGKAMMAKNPLKYALLPKKTRSKKKG